jgi:hypothetical protein
MAQTHLIIQETDSAVLTTSMDNAALNGWSLFNFSVTDDGSGTITFTALFFKVN